MARRSAFPTKPDPSGDGVEAISRQAVTTRPSLRLCLVRPPSSILPSLPIRPWPPWRRLSMPAHSGPPLSRRRRPASHDRTQRAAAATTTTALSGRVSCAARTRWMTSWASGPQAVLRATSRSSGESTLWVWQRERDRESRGEARHQRMCQRRTLLIRSFSSR